jgi:tetratricopeptide (TPR) repeat protein
VTGYPGDLPALLRSMVPESVGDGAVLEWAAQRIEALVVDTGEPLTPRGALARVVQELEEGRAALEALLDARDGPFAATPEMPMLEQWGEGTTVLAGHGPPAPPELARKTWAQWRRTFAAAFLQWRLPELSRLIIQISFPLPGGGGTDRESEVFRGAVVEPAGRPGLHAVVHLLEATEEDGVTPLLDRELRSGLLVLKGRILLALGEGEAAVPTLLSAVEMAPKDGRPLAALGDYFRLLGSDEPTGEARGWVESFGRWSGTRPPGERNRDAAVSLYERATALAPGAPDPWVGWGRLLEEEGNWDDADDRYSQAIRLARDEGGVERLGALFPSLGGGLHLQHARMLRREGDDAGALEALDRALHGDPSPYQRRIGERLRGEILEALGRSQEAAAAYYRSASEFLQGGDARLSTDLFRRSLKLDPEHLLTYWSLADALRIVSFRQPPENVDAGMLLEALGVWQAGASIRLPQAEDAWGWAVLAGIHEQRARLPGEDPWAATWEAVLSLERALALRPGDTFRLTDLARCYRTLRLPGASLDAAGRAMAAAGDNASVLEERIITLTNNAWFDEALELLDRREALEPGPWNDAVRGFIVAWRGEFRRALELVDRVQEEPGEETFWMQEVRALCRRELGEREEADRLYRGILDRYDPDDRENQASFAWAAYQLGEYDRAVPLFQGLLSDRLSAPRAHRNLGLTFLRRGDLERAQREFQQGLPEANRWDLLDLATYELGQVERAAAASGEGEALLDFIRELREEVRARVALLEAPPSAEAELLGVVVDADGREGEEGRTPRVAARAGLARILGAERRWREAGEVLAFVVDGSGEAFPEAAAALVTAVEGMEGEAMEQAAEDPGAALALLRETLVLAEGRAPAPVLLRLQARAVVAALLAGDAEAAHRHLRGAAAVSAREAEGDLAEALVEAGAALIHTPRGYWTVDRGVAGLGELPATVREGLRDTLGRLLGLDPTAETVSVVTPVAVELAWDLVPHDTGPDWPLLKRHIPEMRERIRDDLGVTVPGVRFRSNEGDMPGGSYIIMLEEVPLVMGTVHPGMAYAPVSVRVLEELGVPAGSIRAQPHPVSGEPGGWIPLDAVPAVEGAGLSVWTDPLRFTVDHVEGVLRGNLGDFLGLQETANLLEEWSGEKGGASLVKSALPSSEDHLPFARLLRALVREGVPIADWRTILGAWPRIRHLAAPYPEEALRRVRRLLRDQLPGNRPGVEKVGLPAETEARLADWFHDEGGRRCFALRPEDTQELLGELRALLSTPSGERVAAGGAGFALVVARPELRLPLRRVVELEFPQVIVLAKEELLAGAMASWEGGPPLDPEEAREDGELDGAGEVDVHG